MAQLAGKMQQRVVAVADSRLMTLEVGVDDVPDPYSPKGTILEIVLIRQLVTVSQQSKLRTNPRSILLLTSLSTTCISSMLRSVMK